MLDPPSITRLYEINCKERTYKTINVYGKIKEGFHKEANKNDNPDLFDSGEIKPDGSVTILWKMLCK